MSILLQTTLLRLDSASDTSSQNEDITRYSSGYENLDKGKKGGHSQLEMESTRSLSDPTNLISYDCQGANYLTWDSTFLSNTSSTVPYLHDISTPTKLLNESLIYSRNGLSPARLCCSQLVDYSLNETSSSVQGESASLSNVDDHKSVLSELKEKT